MPPLGEGVHFPVSTVQLAGCQRLLSWLLSLKVALGQQQRASYWESMELPALEDYGHDSIHDVFTYA